PGAAQARSVKPKVSRVSGVPHNALAGDTVRVKVRLTGLPKRRSRAAWVTLSLRARPDAPSVRLRSRKVRRTQRSRRRTLKVRVVLPSDTASGGYTLRVCVRTSSRRKGSCRGRRLFIRARVPAGSPANPNPPGPPAPLPPGPPDQPGPPPADDSGHSLRAPVTGERFYFVMADRFENGDEANDDGGLPPGTGEGQSGHDPTQKGFYHGGDLAGLLEQIDYIHDLGTTAIWLTPSFKNKAVQPEDKSAGYHGYWITDFTQIDPHLGTNAELQALVDAAHARGMKLYFDIITNHTADVIQYDEGARTGYVGKDARPYTEAGTENPFDDRDFAGTDAFPALDPDTSFPYHPFTPAGGEDLKVPAWLNDVTAYHNRGNTTFTGEDSQYGDFFGLDDLFTEQPRVVQGMTDIYKAWIRDFGIDGFRIDTMKHVDDAFWQKFAPAILRYAHEQGKPEFFLFGEVFDTSKSFTSHFTTHDQVQAVLDFPFQEAARSFASRGNAADELRSFFAGDDWYTDADSNAYQLPTFLGNHDMGRIGNFLRSDNGGADDAEILARDRLAHELMYFARGNPVVYYGDEQGFVGDGGDQDARQDMFPSQVASYNDDDLIGTDATTADANFDRSHPVYESIARLAQVTTEHPALRSGAQQHRYASAGPGIYAFSRLDRGEQREYVVALNNAETEQTASVPTYERSTAFRRIYGEGAPELRSGAGGDLALTVPPLSAVVYEAAEKVPASRAAPPISLNVPGTGLDRLEVAADVAGTSFYEVTFEARTGDGDWQAIGTDDNAPYRVLHDVADVPPGTAIQYRATVLDNAGHRQTSVPRTATITPPRIALEAPNTEGRVRGEVEVRAAATPEHATDSVELQRRVGEGEWTAIGTDTSSPVYTAFDDTTGLANGTRVSYRAVLTYAPGQTVTSEERTVEVVSEPVTTAIVHYQRPAGDYADWGLHLWGDAIADGVATTWDAPRQRDAVDDYGAVYEIPLSDDTKAVNFIVHRPSGDQVPETREPGGDRSFVPLEHPEIWLRAGESQVYYAPPPEVVPRRR
ncbi:MAG TPA: alpha-amylase family glycosyl hydrolase, partial [Solirubrobacteraceae bacterium]